MSPVAGPAAFSFFIDPKVRSPLPPGFIPAKLPEEGFRLLVPRVSETRTRLLRRSGVRFAAVIERSQPGEGEEAQEVMENPLLRDASDGRATIPLGEGEGEPAGNREGHGPCDPSNWRWTWPGVWVGAPGVIAAGGTSTVRSDLGGIEWDRRAGRASMTHACIGMPWIGGEVGPRLDGGARETAPCISGVSPNSASESSGRSRSGAEWRLLRRSDVS